MHLYFDDYLLKAPHYTALILIKITNN